MPNHITTVCKVSGPDADVAAFEAAHIKENTGPDEREKFYFDLGSVIPKPPIVDKTESGSEADAGFYALTGLVVTKFIGLATHPVIHYTGRGFTAGPLTTHEDFCEWLEANHPHVVEKGRVQLQCFRETGYMSWYDWSYGNWGTKWNSYQYKVRNRTAGSFTFEFQTANGVPTPVFKRLVGKYPGLTFDIVSIDEGGPEFVGRFSDKEEHFEEVEHDLDRYRMVYGRDPYSDDEDN